MRKNEIKKKFMPKITGPVRFLDITIKNRSKKIITWNKNGHGKTYFEFFSYEKGLEEKLRKKIRGKYVLHL